SDWVTPRGARSPPRVKTPTSAGAHERSRSIKPPRSYPQSDEKALLVGARHIRRLLRPHGLPFFPPIFKKPSREDTVGPSRFAFQQENST
ncbi:MAG TPA: hypothetical protein VFQ61_35860, partial [Polyangiaceae bacterium]|nr:hypothetical protein [Polyangiaceae bacterium]